MTFIVTGSNGFIGANTCRRLVDLGEEVIGVDDLSSGLAKDSVDGAEYHVHCITDVEWLTRLFQDTKPRAVLHLAAVPLVPRSVEHPLESANSNLLGTVSVLEAVLKAQLVGRTRVVFASSSSVYGGAEQLPTPETHRCDPQSPYALAKLQSEGWCKLFHRLYGLDVVSLRYFNVFGPGARFGGAYSTVLPAWLHHLYVDGSCQPYVEGDGTQSRDFCFIDSVVQANVTAATRARGFAAEVLNVARGRAYSLLDVKAALEEIAGRELLLERRPPRVGDVKHTLADILQVQKALDYAPSNDFLAELAKTAAWFAEYHPAPIVNA